MPLSRRARPAVGAALVLSSLALHASADEGGADAKAACASRAEHGQRAKLDGHLRAAREDFLACAQDSCPEAVRRACTEWLGETERGLPSVVVVVRGANGVNAPPAQAWIDDHEIDAASGRAIPIDPGAHVVRARSATGAEGTARIVAIEGRKAEVIPVPIAGSEPSPTTRPSDGERSRPTFTTGRWIAVGIGAAGALGLGAAGLVGLSARSRYEESAPFCTAN